MSHMDNFHDAFHSFNTQNQSNCTKNRDQHIQNVLSVFYRRKRKCQPYLKQHEGVQMMTEFSFLDNQSL